MADSRPTPAASPTARAGIALGALGRSLGGPAFEAITAPPIARAGAALATHAARLWGRVLGGEERREGELHVITGLPQWAFGRGGTTVGATYLTRASDSPDVLEHEDVHRQQWERYGLWFIPMYFAAGAEGTKNRFEIEAGLEKGGYLPKDGSARRERRRSTGSEAVRAGERR
ncbi:hypothetical protein [Agrococcus baldri]|uniref:Fe-S oxidoreductase n=1 Tax=Agrococcus baldri TaxID=153730 RepID=A0AA87UT59_9MICO|nr:hypothetical protein [Agrococcus baldri]GEK81165.1 hypothetical protein ABA31_25160 [Agrococcus baldri]